MELANIKERYIADKDRAMSNLSLIEAEAERLKGVVLRLEGAIGAIQELEGGPPLVGGPAVPVSSPKEVPEGETEENENESSS